MTPTLTEPLTLVNDLDGSSRDFVNGIVLDPAVSYHIHATGNDATKSIKFRIDANNPRIVNGNVADSKSRTWLAGDHSAVVRPFPQLNAQGTSGPAVTVAFKSAVTVPTDGSIASRYPGDIGIENDPAVIFADNFESYISPTEAIARWGNGNGAARMRIATEPEHVFSGSKSLEIALPASTSEISASLIKKLSQTQDVLFVRMYQKFDVNYDNSVGSNHNGIRISANYPEQSGTKPPADGTGFFLFLMQNNVHSFAGETVPGFTDLYVYWPHQRSMWGDHWLPGGNVIPGGQGDWILNPSQYPDFKPLPNFNPQRDKWYCVELMVKANTPGKNDGEAKYWIDGQLAGDYPDLFLRSISSLKIDHAHLLLHTTGDPKPLKKWHDNVVIATKYIGPMV